ncbi:MAG: hypothetical protein ACYDH9_22660 [Limisphaerales bacterium]
MSGSEKNNWLEAGLHRPLTADEERRLAAYLGEHPAERAAWEEDLRLNQLLRQLPDAPMPTNFTAQVWQAVERELGRPPARVPVWRWGWLGGLGWARPAVLTALVCALGLAGYHRYRAHVRVELARSVATISTVATIPTVEMLENFDAINRLSQAPPIPDKDLLAALQ